MKRVIYVTVDVQCEVIECKGLGNDETPKLIITLIEMTTVIMGTRTKDSQVSLMLMDDSSQYSYSW